MKLRSSLVMLVLVLICWALTAAAASTASEAGQGALGRKLRRDGDGDAETREDIATQDAEDEEDALIDNAATSNNPNAIATDTNEAADVNRGVYASGLGRKLRRDGDGDAETREDIATQDAEDEEDALIDNAATSNNPIAIASDTKKAADVNRGVYASGLGRKLRRFLV